MPGNIHHESGTGDVNSACTTPVTVPATATALTAVPTSGTANNTTKDRGAARLKLMRQESGKKTVPPMIICSGRLTHSHFKTLSKSIRIFTKKTGAGVHRNSTETMSELIESLNESLQPIQQIMSMKQILIDVRLQMILLNPWISHFNQLFSNIIRLLNDRVSMLWRKSTSSNTPSSTPFESACSLYEDVNEIMNILHKISVIFSPKQVSVLKRFSVPTPYSHIASVISTPGHISHSQAVTTPGPLLSTPQNTPSQNPNTVVPTTNAIIAPPSPQSTSNTSLSALNPNTATLPPTNPNNSFPNQNTNSGTTSMIIDCEMCVIAKQFLIRCRFHLHRTLPTLLKRIEQYLVAILNTSLQGLCENCLTKGCFVISKHSLNTTTTSLSPEQQPTASSQHLVPTALPLSSIPVSFSFTPSSSISLSTPPPLPSVHSLGSLILSSLLSPLLRSAQSNLHSKHSRERIFTVCVNTSVEGIFNHIKEKKLFFNEYGVYALYTQLYTVYQWVIECKHVLCIPLSTPLIVDLSPWHRANSIMSVLLMATSGEYLEEALLQNNSTNTTPTSQMPHRSYDGENFTEYGGSRSRGNSATTTLSPPGVGSNSTLLSDKRRKLSRHLTVFEYERWVELGVPPKMCGCLPLRLLPKKWRKRGIGSKTASISLSTVLDVRDI